IRHRDPGGDETEPLILRSQLLDERLQRGILELALLPVRTPLQRLHAIEDEDRPLLPYQRRQPLPPVPRGSGLRVRIPEPPQRRSDTPLRRPPPVGPRAVDRPPDPPLGPAPPGRIHPPQPSVPQRALPPPAPGHEAGHPHSLRPALVEPGQLGLAAEEILP